MKVKVAVFGQKETINRIKTYIDGQQDIEVKPFIYTNEKETTELIGKAFMCDIYLFTGPLSYLYAKKEIAKNRLPFVQIDFDGYMILAAFYRMKNNHDRLLNRLSVDIPDKNDVEDVLHELQIIGKEVYVYSLDTDKLIDVGTVVAHHQRLWNAGKIDYVLTTIHEVEGPLKKLGIPTSSMIIPQKNIERAIARAKTMANISQSKSAQIIAGFIRIKDLEKLKTKRGTSFTQKLIESLQQVLTKFAEKTASSVLLNSKNQFVLFGTKGLLEHITVHYRDFPLLQEIEATVQVPVEIGFGLGLYVQQAEDHAKMALKFCEKAGDSKCYIVNEQQDMIGPLGIKKDFDTSALYQSLIHKARLNNELSYNFIDFIAIRNNEPFSSNDIAIYYQVTKRSAERTINKLLSGNVIKVAGEERPYIRGRPRKLFTLNQ